MQTKHDHGYKRTFQNQFIVCDELPRVWVELLLSQSKWKRYSLHTK